MPRASSASLLLIIAGFTLLMPDSEGRSRRTRLLPNSAAVPGQSPETDVGCVACHTDPNGESQRNSFGMDVEEFIGGSSSSSIPFWGSVLAAMDSDGDGFTNGEELGDPNGTLLQQMFGQPVDQPFTLEPVSAEDLVITEFPERISNPGDPNSVPPASSEPTDTPTPLPPTEEPTSTEAPPAPTHTSAPPTDTPAPTATATPQVEPTEPPVPLDLEPDGLIDIRDVLLHLKNARNREKGTLAPTDWFAMSFFWREKPPQ